MDIGSLTGLNRISNPAGISSVINGTAGSTKTNFANGILSKNTDENSSTASFDSLLQSAMDMITETNDYTNEAAEAEMAFAMGITNNTHDLQSAQMKANISLQYTVAVRNAVMDAYKEIMQIQF